jgi:RimJ/RimL family protein N-acetyltransferase
VIARVRDAARLRTERLLMREPDDADARAIFEEYAADPDVTRYLAWKPHASVDGVLDFLAQQRDAEAAGKARSWVITMPPEDRALGSIDCRFEGHTALLGWVLAKRLWGRGLMTEAVRAVGDWALADAAIARVWAVCDVANPASLRVMEKAGMRCEGVLRRWSVHPNVSDEPRDCFVCSRIRDASAGV